MRIYQCQWFYQTSSQVDVCNEVIEEKCVEKEEEKCTNVTNEQCKTVNDEASNNFFSQSFAHSIRCVRMCRRRCARR